MDQLREAFRAANRADLVDWRARQAEESEDEGVTFADAKLAFMDAAVVADYVGGVVYVALDGGDDYHAVVTTDASATRHRSEGLAKLTLDWLADV
jgi:hypothetical protein